MVIKMGLDNIVWTLGTVGGLGTALVGKILPYTSNFNPENLATTEKMITYGLIGGIGCGVILAAKLIAYASNGGSGYSSGGCAGGFFSGCGGGGCGGGSGCGGGGCGGGCGGG